MKNRSTLPNTPRTRTRISSLRPDKSRFHTAMVAVLLCAVLAFLSAAEAGRAEVSDDANGQYSTTDLKYIAYLAEVFNLSTAMGDDIWPGLDYTRIPMLLYRPDSIAFLFNHSAPPEGFSNTGGLPWEFENPVYVHRGALEGYVGQFWTVFDVGGTPTFVCPYAEDSTYESRFFTFVAHEAFHTFQAYEFADLGDTREQYYPITLVDNNARATLENLILAKAADALITDNRAEVTKRARQFAAVREFRLANATPFVRHHEQVKERLENTAFYVEKRCQEGGTSAGYQPTNFSEYTTFDFYLTRTEVLELLKEGIEDHVSAGAIVPAAMPRYRIYDNGATLGYLLDYLDIDWKDGAMRDTAFLFHQPLMDEFAIPTDADPLNREISDIKKEFQYDEILAAARDNIERYLHDAMELEEQIRASGKYEFRVVMNTKAGLSKSKRSSKRVLYVDEGERTLIELADKFLMKTSRASVQAENSGLIFSRSRDGETATLEAFAETRPETISVDGKEVRFNDGEYHSSASLVVEIGKSLVIRGEAGAVSVSGTLVEIHLD